MRVLITGAGMVGCHAAGEMLAQGHEVTLLDLAPGEAYVRRVAGDGARVVRGDVRELPGLIEAVQKARAEVVVHTAGLIGGAAQQIPYRGFQINIGGTLNVAEAARLCGVRRLLHASTLGVHDLSRPQTAPLGEDFPTDGGGATYGASKVAAEQILRVYAATYGIELGLLRFASAYGYGLYAGGSGMGIAMNRIVLSALEGRPVPISGRLSLADELVYAKDLGRGVRLAAEAPALRHPVYNLGGGAIHTADSIIETLRRLIPGVTVGERPPAPREAHQRLHPMDLNRSRADLGYEPRFDLEAGLADYIAELRRS